MVWLHFGLTASRYSPLWVVLIVPTLAALSSRIPWLAGPAAKIGKKLSPDLRAADCRKPGPGPFFQVLSLPVCSFWPRRGWAIWGGTVKT